MKRFAILLFGILSYIMFQGTFAYLIGFVGNLFVPVTLDGVATSSLGYALLINVALVILFGLQHSGMARQGFKKWLTKWMPVSMERSFYVFCTNVALIILMSQWEPMGGVVWSISHVGVSAFLYTLFFCGWGIVLFSSFLIDHFELFGLKQVYMNFVGKSLDGAKFRTPALYKIVRHPLYFGLLISFWATPTMTITHLFFSLLMTGYVFIGIAYEERDLKKIFGDLYLVYQQQVPKIIPNPWKKTISKNKVNEKILG